MLAFIQDDISEAQLEAMPVDNLESLKEWTYEQDGAGVKVLRSKTGVLQGCAVFPTTTWLAWQFRRRLLMFDGAHLSTISSRILLLATTIDADEATIVLTRASTRTKSKDTWRLFFEMIARSLKEAYDEDAEGLAIISDRQKGLGPAISEYLPDAWHYWCTQHLADNVGHKYIKAVEQKFRYAMQVTKRSEHAHSIKKRDQRAFGTRLQYIMNIGDKKRYVSPARLKRKQVTHRFGYCSSYVPC